LKNKYEIVGDMVEIELNNRAKEVYIVKVSVEDFDIVNEIKGKWHCHYTKSGIYAKAIHKNSDAKDKKYSCTG